MRDYKLVCIFAVLLVASASVVKDNKEDEPKRVKRGIIAATGAIAGAISAGTSLAGTTVTALQRRDYGVAVSGSVENYSKWPLTIRGCENRRGYMNVPMGTVQPGQREGFASYKNGGTASGSWVSCSYLINTNVMIHISYSAPYDFNFYPNVLSLAVCTASNPECQTLDAYGMYYYTWDNVMVRRSYYYDSRTLKICRSGLCVTGLMGTSHHPVIDIKVMPTSYENLSDAAKAASLRERFTKSDYENMVSSL